MSYEQVKQVMGIIRAYSGWDIDEASCERIAVQLEKRGHLSGVVEQKEGE